MGRKNSNKMRIKISIRAQQMQEYYCKAFKLSKCPSWLLFPILPNQLEVFVYLFISIWNNGCYQGQQAKKNTSFK